MNESQKAELMEREQKALNLISISNISEWTNADKIQLLDLAGEISRALSSNNIETKIMDIVLASI